MGQRSVSRRRGAAIGDVFRVPDLRRLQVGWAAFFFVDGTSLVATSVWAFRDHGAGGAGFVGLARLLPGALALPFGAWAADRFPRRRVVVAVFLAITATQATIAIALVAGAPGAIVYLLVALNSVAATPYRPAHLALIPLVVRSPEELVAVNVTAGTVEGFVTFTGPALAAVMLAWVEPWTVVLVCAAAALGGMTAVARIELEVLAPALAGPSERPGQALLGGLVELRGNVDLMVIVGCFVAQLLVRGMLNVLVVAVAFDLIGLGSSGVGWLSAAIGVGGILGAVGTVTLTARRRLALPFALALALWGLPITVIGVAPHTSVVVLALATIGIGNAMLDVAGFTLIQRLGIHRTLARVFGVLFTFGIALGGVGAVATPGLISAVGIRPALVVVGLLLPLLAVLLVPRFRSIDAHAEPPSEVLTLLARVPIFSTLTANTLERLAVRATVLDVRPDDVVVAEGVSGDEFYVVVSGAVEVVQAGVSRRMLGPGDEFGQIALLRGTPRTATVVARRPTRLVVMTSRDFVDGLSSSPVAFAHGLALTNALLSGDDR